MSQDTSWERGCSLCNCYSWLPVRVAGVWFGCFHKPISPSLSPWNTRTARLSVALCSKLAFQQGILHSCTPVSRKCFTWYYSPWRRHAKSQAAHGARMGWERMCRTERGQHSKVDRLGQSRPFFQCCRGAYRPAAFVRGWGGVARRSSPSKELSQPCCTVLGTTEWELSV